MAYGVNAPFGFRPLYSLSGGPWTEKLNPYYIFAPADGVATYARSIFTGDAVYWRQATLIGGSGTIGLEVDTAPDAGLALGVFQGCEYTDVNGNPVYSPYWPASTMVQQGTKIKAKVLDDPFTVYDIQVSTADADITNATWNPGDMSLNAKFAVAAGGDPIFNPPGGNVKTGISAGYLDGSTSAITATLQLKVLGYTEHPSNYIYNSAGAVRPYLNVRVMFNAMNFKSVGTIGILGT